MRTTPQGRARGIEDRQLSLVGDARGNTRSSWIALGALSFGYFVVVLYTAIVFTASAAIERGLHASFDQLLWILNGFALMLAVALIPASRLADMFGPKRMFLIGLAGFTLATSACGLAPSATALIVCRLLAGLGAALMMTQTLSYVTWLFPPRQRGAAIGVWGGIGAVSGALGPTIGGFMATSFGWQSVFYMCLPLGIGGVIVALLVLPEVDVGQAHQIDTLDILLLAAGLFCGLYAFIESQRYDWGPISGVGRFAIGSSQWSLWSIDSCLAYAAVLLALFVWRDMRVPEPMLPLPLFRDRSFVLGSGIMVLVTFMWLGMFAPMILYFETVLGFSAEKAGLTLLPSGLMPVIAAPLAGRLVERIKGRYVLCASLLVTACGFALVSRTIALGNTQASFIFPLAVMGFGLGGSFTAVITLTMRDVQPALAGAGSGFVNAARQASGSIGGVILGTVLAHQIAAAIPARIAQVVPQVPARVRTSFTVGFVQSVSSVGTSGTGRRPTPGTPEAVLHQLVALAHQIADQAFVLGLRPTMAIPAGLSLLGAAGALAMPRSVPSSKFQVPSIRPSPSAPISQDSDSSSAS